MGFDLQTAVVLQRSSKRQDQPVCKLLWDAQVFRLTVGSSRRALPDDRLARVQRLCGNSRQTPQRSGGFNRRVYIRLRALARLVLAPIGWQARQQLGLDIGTSHGPTDPGQRRRTSVSCTTTEFWADYRDDIDAKFQALRWRNKRCRPFGGGHAASFHPPVCVIAIFPNFRRT